MTTDSQARPRMVALEEHFALPELVDRIDPGVASQRGYYSLTQPYSVASRLDQLAELGAGRLGAMDAVGLTMQILSLDGPGADLLAPADGVSFARDANDMLADEIARHPDRYAGFAHLPLTDPAAAAAELTRCVDELGFHGAMIRGATGGHYLDDPSFEPLLACSESLGVPLYVHPAPSPKPARDALYAGLPGDLSFWLSISGWGWHTDTATHILRMVLGGVFDRHPGLQIIIGHLGEGLATFLPRFDQQFHTFGGMSATPSEILLEHLSITISGFLILPSFLTTLETFGVERMMYSVDYPFGSLESSRAFFDELPLGLADRDKIAHANAERLLNLGAPGSPSSSRHRITDDYGSSVRVS